MPYVELSECLRVFPDRFKSRQPSAPVDSISNPEVGNQVAQGFHELLAKNGTLETELATIKERLQNEERRRIDAEERESWMRNHVDKLTEENQKLLAAPFQEKRGLWARFFGKEPARPM